MQGDVDTVMYPGPGDETPRTNASNTITAVAGENLSLAGCSQPSVGRDDDDASSVALSVLGDSLAGDNDDDDDPQQPKTPRWMPKLEDRSRGSLPSSSQLPRSSERNNEPEVGNCGIYFGNWGARGTVADKKEKKLRQAAHDHQIMRNPGHIIILCEANAAVEALLKQPPQPGDEAAEQRLQRRSSHEHWVVRGNEEGCAVLIAARKDNTTALEYLHYEVYDDHPYKEKKKNKVARSRILICKVTFKQNVGHLGKDIVVCGVHGNSKTMTVEWPVAWAAFWDRLAEGIKTFGVRFMAGDFNMSVTEVPKQLRSRGISVVCVAWYPWRLDGVAGNEQPLGLDSCGIFHVGDAPVLVELAWDLGDLQHLTAVADTMLQTEADPEFPPTKKLHAYEKDKMYPGQPWKCYRSGHHKEAVKDLAQKLEDLLTRTEQNDPARLEEIPRTKNLCPYLRLRQKNMDKNAWMPHGILHNGAHFPLAVFTRNSSARSEEAETKRRDRSKGRRQQQWQQSQQQRQQTQMQQQWQHWQQQSQQQWLQQQWLQQQSHYLQQQSQQQLQQPQSRGHWDKDGRYHMPIDHVTDLQRRFHPTGTTTTQQGATLPPHSTAIYNPFRTNAAATTAVADATTSGKTRTSDEREDNWEHVD